MDDLFVQDAKIDVFGVGENLITSSSSPVLGGVYKVVAYENERGIIPTVKISDNVEKITNPGFKKLIRFYDKKTHKALADVLFLKDEMVPEHEFLLFDPNAPWKQKLIDNYTIRELQVPVFLQGECIYRVKSTEEVKEYCKQEMDTLWDELKRLKFPHKYYVDLSRKLYDLKFQLIEENRK